MISEVLMKHDLWLRGNPAGVRADLRGADLQGADLQGADLQGADLRYANLRYANLRGANLRYANLRGADLRYANLRYANLQGADLRYANLRGANLRYANLRYANLQDAILYGANLHGTCLDPMRPANGEDGRFSASRRTRSGQVWLRGYRTRSQPVMGGPAYFDGEFYSAPWFSVADTECHPGLYVKPHCEKGDIIVEFQAHNLHRAGNKFRVREFFVEGEYRG